MKKQLISLASLLMISFAFAQGGGFNYKALITDNGNVLNNHAVTLKFTLLENGTTAVYQETQTGNTDANGIVAVKLGEGTVISGNFSTINWGSNPYFLKIEIDTGSGYQDFGTQELKSVPYAKFAEKAGNVFSGDFGDLSNVPAGLADGDDDTHLTDAQIGAMGYIKNPDDADHDASNELQTISKTGSTVTLSNNGGSFTDNDTHLTDTDISSMGYIKNADDADHDASNELQNLSLSGTQLSITNGTGVDFTNWDTNANDDFSGDFNDLSNQPVTFLRSVDNNNPNDMNDDIYHLGNIAIGQQLSFAGARLSIVQNGNSNDDNTGIIIENTNNGANTHYGIQSFLNGSNATDYIGISTELRGTGSGQQYGSLVQIYNSGGADHYGNYAQLTGDGNGNHYGYSSWLDGSGEGRQYGSEVFISNSGNNFHYGYFSELSGNGSGSQFGGYSYLNGNGTGVHYGNYTQLSGSGSGHHYGSYNDIEGNGTGPQYGIMNMITNSGNNTHYGNYSLLNGSGSGYHYGTYNDIEGNGTGPQFGIRNRITNSGDNSHYGNFTELSGDGSGDHYGSYIYLSGLGNGAKYGSYNEISQNAGGTHYAVYGKALKSGSYAGYFDGDVYASKKLKAPASGDTDMKAYVYGYLLPSGNNVNTDSNKSSDGFTASRVVAGKYRIVLTGLTNYTNYIVTANAIATANPRFVTYVINNNSFDIYIWDINGNLIDSDVSFVVYKK